MAEPELCVVVKSESDARALRALLRAELTGTTRFFATRGKNSITTVARNLIVHEGGPVEREVEGQIDPSTVDPVFGLDQSGRGGLSLSRSQH